MKERRVLILKYYGVLICKQPIATTCSEKEKRTACTYRDMRIAHVNQSVRTTQKILKVAINHSSDHIQSNVSVTS